MTKQALLTLLLIMITPCLMAQKKEISQARSYIKSGNSLDRAEKLMKELLEKNPENKQNTKIYLLWYQAVKKQYEAGNEKLYLKQKYDTAIIYSQTKKMFDILIALDSVDAAPNKKGKVSPKFRKKHSEELSIYRPNLYYGGSFFMKKKDYKSAFELFDLYLTTIDHPMFERMKYYDSDTIMSRVAYLATYCAYAMNDAERILKRSSMALGDTANSRYVIQYLAEAYKLSGDERKYEETLNMGFDKYPDFNYFFPHLMDFYNSKEMLTEALALTEKALKFDDKNILYLYAKSSTLFTMERYTDCIKTCDKIISICDTIAPAYYHAGMSYLIPVLYMEQDKENKSYLKSVYEKALPYMEKYRKLAPKEQKKWAMPLYRIYLNLNMGKEFEEIDRLLNKR